MKNTFIVVLPLTAAIALNGMSLPAQDRADGQKADSASTPPKMHGIGVLAQFRPNVGAEAGIILSESFKLSKTIGLDVVTSATASVSENTYTETTRLDQNSTLERTLGGARNWTLYSGPQIVFQNGGFSVKGGPLLGVNLLSGEITAELHYPLSTGGIETVPAGRSNFCDMRLNIGLGGSIGYKFNKFELRVFGSMCTPVTNAAKRFDFDKGTRPGNWTVGVSGSFCFPQRARSALPADKPRQEVQGREGAKTVR